MIHSTYSKHYHPPTTFTGGAGKLRPCRVLSSTWILISFHAVPTASTGTGGPFCFIRSLSQVIRRGYLKVPTRKVRESSAEKLYRIGRFPTFYKGTNHDSPLPRFGGAFTIERHHNTRFVPHPRVYGFVLTRFILPVKFDGQSSSHAHGRVNHMVGGPHRKTVLDT